MIRVATGCAMLCLAAAVSLPAQAASGFTVVNQHENWVNVLDRNGGVTDCENKKPKDWAPLKQDESWAFSCKDKGTGSCVVEVLASDAETRLCGDNADTCPVGGRNVAMTIKNGATLTISGSGSTYSCEISGP